MNYRHAYHAGNPADCVKHALLVLLLRALTAKPKPLFVLDTHAGIGAYDLTAIEAGKTGEWRAGIGRLRQTTPPALADFMALTGTAEHYPGSPALARALLRPQDRLALCELHPDDATTLKRRFARDPQVHIHRRDGYEALTALLPPPERRALVLIDPPFEKTDEFETLAAALQAAHRKFPTGVYAAWYPVKHRAPVRDFIADIQARGIADIITCEILFREPLDPARLNGCGVLIVNPPYNFEATAAPVLEALCATLAEPDGASRITRLADA
ncbi:MAG: 23S rRNA (adenine(2030)-N(6))-methyltransferase RlmJ [Acidiphilium sp. 37-64-53]|uniref:23S rRNA (adenine(2030)-N(6))-methyltransferase RlmJ n=1 Tax=Acidiphilium TaxID=522 RepID=UPI000BD64162|nr:MULTISPECIES: 23S rRNA (adenine(2030)-N(6))-methyltransferase RlmJ [Acidiphilium]OYW01288.1 MAG: 23S rRNA (adenine(2030)-N(6))-methyltransferase RlmJ [Acidiphilium sp. 37-64-53]OZB26991.1 MAG: 23S rRNA (adenine(2030)-N(6))-methyltransferase RlmJ [Acidiphilium sp. 34-64-41]HQT86013.1 23S rRNA (adenine(2030)-N(6))-methyltransferase RlmJ [Acidiphilium rubrum]